MENGGKFSWGKNRQAQIEVARYFGYVADLNFILAYSFFYFLIDLIVQRLLMP